MNGYLANLVHRTLGAGPSAQPRPYSAFETGPLLTSAREVIEEESGRETRSNTNASLGKEAVVSRLESETPDAEASKMPAVAAIGKAEHDTEPTLLRLPPEAQEPETLTLQKPRLRSTRRALTDTAIPASPEPAQVRISAIHPERSTNDLHDDEGAETPLAPAPHFRATSPRSIAHAHLDRTNEGVNSNDHKTIELSPVVKVTIGRVEVRAAPAPERPAQRPKPSGPALSLDDYLKVRDGRRA